MTIFSLLKPEGTLIIANQVALERSTRSREASDIVDLNICETIGGV